MTPDQINTQHGKPSWRCNTCGATSGLTWWNGLSVAVCRDNANCRRVEGEKYAASVAEQEWWAAYEIEWLGGSE